MKYERILVGLDGSPQSERAFEVGCQLAKALSAKLFLVWIVNRDRGMDSYFGVSEDFYRDQYQQVTQKIQPFIKKAADLGIDVDGQALVGNTKVILSKSFPTENKIGLIILGQTGRNVIGKLSIGSHSSYVLQNADVDVLIVK
ncbi:universal stress protein [Lentilactobacillus farraginis]|uniref:Putative universel stress protein n=1 Tax=Lentilactobacillus farraginis DSM 18382 = JCM 14108 TaxID=1423743 RepID=X0PMM5_9LACO|nr:universal stress protein [Lentilactobacillus farraginis]KRM07878.1 putative universel stress protein [Lentilactobacillus farraginis DSM 18382 = JCM 14108]GAF38106.1 universal stress protein family [Lentilactobacillus farraginis DSM 18382 = JCM 14108]